MRRTVLAGLLACSFTFVMGSGEASAMPNEITQTNSDVTVAMLLADVTDSEIEETEKSKDKTVEHKVEKGESLSKIANTYETEWKRIYDKNLEIEHPDVIEAEDVLVIPDADEVLEPRELPVTAATPTVDVVAASTTEERAPTQQSSAQSVAPTPVGSSSGNGYVHGYCTWYVKNRKPNLPNNLGNANTWASNAAAQGFTVSSTPRVGAAAQALSGTMHVAYVESVNGDGTVTVSEMNFVGFNVVSSRTVSASSFVYIY